MHQPKARYRDLHPELFDAEQYEYWKAEWGGMPEYSHELATPFKSITIHFRNAEDVAEASRRLNLLLNKGKSFWFPAEAVDE